MFDATLFLRCYAKLRTAQLDSFDSARVQERQLLWLLRRAQSTRFARDHRLQGIDSVAEYQRRVPLRSYEQLWNEYWSSEYPNVVDCTWPGRIPFFAVSSGTSSGTTKYIPCTREMINSNSKTGIDLFVHHVRSQPTSRIFGGKNFMLGGSTALVRETEGVLSGDLSGIAMETLPWWLRSRSFPPPELALLKNWEEKIDRLAHSSLGEPIRSIGGVPSWLLIFFEKFKTILPESDGRLCSIFPELDLLIHGGVNFAHYRKQFIELLQGSRAELREVYPASEGFIAVADRGYGEGLRLALDTGLFYEFVPVEELDSPNPTRHWMVNVEPDVNYAIVLTTCAGLWSYIVGDTVRFVDRHPPRVLITGRTSYYLSAFGEHLIAEEIEDGVQSAAEAIGAQVSEYSVGALYPEDTGDIGGHLYVVEFCGTAPTTAQLKVFSEVLDQRLSARNEDYQAHRAEGYGLRAPEILSVPAGFFTAWMKQRGKLGGQNKVPRIVTDQDLFRSLRDFELPT